MYCVLRHPAQYAIKMGMTRRFTAVWHHAEPYLRARKSDIHVPLSYWFAERLVECHPEADAEVVLLGILLHDVGWAIIDEDDIFNKAFGSDEIMSGEARRQIVYRHEAEGARLARHILTTTATALDKVDEICQIIDGHDSRLQALSLNDALVKDADKLWRFTETGIAIAATWFKRTPTQYALRLELDIIPQLFTEAAREMATAALHQSRQRLLLDVLS